MSIYINTTKISNFLDMLPLEESTIEVELTNDQTIPGFTNYTDEIKKDMSDKRKAWIENNYDAFMETIRNRKRPDYDAVYTVERNAKISNILKGRDITWGDKISESLKNQKKYTCEHCGKENNIGNHRRWHGNNCKSLLG